VLTIRMLDGKLSPLCQQRIQRQWSSGGAEGKPARRSSRSGDVKRLLAWADLPAGRR
jgi:hypothetical protein